MTSCRPLPPRRRRSSLVETDKEIYRRHLQVKRKGFPLYVPEPSRLLPISYQQNGVVYWGCGTYYADRRI